MNEYRDSWIDCGPDAIRVRGYYFPWGTKKIPYARIRHVYRVPLGALRGRARIWGTANPRYWAGLDPKRPRKSAAFVLDLGGSVQPFLTPDDPDAMAAALLSHAPINSIEDGEGRFL